MQNVLRRTCGLDPLPEFGDLGIFGLAFAQLFLDRLDLLSEKVISLRLGKLGADLFLDLAEEPA